MTTPAQPGHTYEDYEACLKYAEERGYWAMYNAMMDDGGYDPTIDYRGLMKD